MYFSSFVSYVWMYFIEKYTGILWNISIFNFFPIWYIFFNHDRQIFVNSMYFLGRNRSIRINASLNCALVMGLILIFNWQLRFFTN